MALTAYSAVFECTREQAEEVALMAGLRHEDLNTRYDLWEDRATGGGGCRIVWKAGVAWISRHSGYPAADITEEVRFFFQEVMKCKPSTYSQSYNPNIYGFDNWIRGEDWEWRLP